MNERGSADLGRILIIDDTPQNVLLIRGQLEPAGYVVESAATGREGLDAAVAQPVGWQNLGRPQAARS